MSNIVKIGGNPFLLLYTFFYRTFAHSVRNDNFARLHKLNPLLINEYQSYKPIYRETADTPGYC